MRQAFAEGQLSEVLVESENYPILRCCSPKNCLIGGSGRVAGDPSDIMAKPLESCDDCTGNVLVRQDSHPIFLSLERVHLLGMQGGACVLQTSAYVVSRES